MAQEGESSAIAIAGDQALRLRPEVRSAALELLEREDSTRVRRMDERAAEWYARTVSDAPDDLAELIYHRLRVKDLAGATAVWRPECAPLLADAEADLSGAARRWLRARLADAAPTSQSVEAWEVDAHKRVRDLLGRGLVPNAEAVVAERRERTDTSPLLIYDAWFSRRRGDRFGAWRLLRDALDVREPIRWSRVLLAARLAFSIGHPTTADRLLDQLARERSSLPPESDRYRDMLALDAAKVA